MRDAQPAASTATVFSEVTPTRNSTPMFSLPKKVFSPNGITAIVSTVGANSAIGASANTMRSADAGVVSSFTMSFTTSASGWNRPNGPQRFGPKRAWNLPMVRRSNQVYSAVDITSAFITMNASATHAAPYANQLGSSASNSP